MSKMTKLQAELIDNKDKFVEECETIGLTKVSEKYGVSNSCICRWYKNMTGMTIHKGTELREVRAMMEDKTGKTMRFTIRKKPKPVTERVILKTAPHGYIW